MTIVLVGHRGTGKSSFLRGLAECARGRDVAGEFLDLDEEIERRERQGVAEVFARGEAAFRLLENQTLREILSRPSTFRVIALGAGFEGPIPRGVSVLWLRRESDALGRTFLNRPRLDPSVSAFDEYRRRFAVREHRFRAWAHQQLVLPEGYDGGLEDFVLRPSSLRTPYDFTLLPEHFRDWDNFWANRATRDVRRFELRDDLLYAPQIARARAVIPPSRILWSVRQDPEIRFVGAVDWPAEFGEPPRHVDIFSKHERAGAFGADGFRSDRAGILKLAVDIHNFSELRAGHDWWMRDPSRRAFLPRSKDGRWRWYRSLFGPRMPVHFFREDQGSSPDQPLLWQTLLQPRLDKHFAAVLGSPIVHSRSPVEHRAFFKGIPFVAIDLPEAEFASAMPFLIQLGLRFAAVTAPLKKAAHAICEELTEEAVRTESVNTLSLRGGRVRGHNTDVLALKEIARDISAREIWLWGGGGIRASVREAFPQVLEFSARTGRPRARGGSAPDLILWGVGRSREFVWPAAEAPVLDLNYADDSPGLEWAAARNLAYQSGLKMFKLQAGFQREFWKKDLV